MTNYGVVLRKLNQLPIKQAAKLVGRSAGWLSEIENDRGEARIGLDEFERIIQAYGGQKHRDKFKIWIANAHRPALSRPAIGFDGAILRYLREKADLSGEEVSRDIGVSKSHLCNLEKGRRYISAELRNKLLQLYGYSPSSYRNFTTEDKRAKNIPIRYKLDILLTQLREESIEELFKIALQKSNQEEKLNP